MSSGTLQGTFHAFFLSSVPVCLRQKVASPAGMREAEREIHMIKRPGLPRGAAAAAGTNPRICPDMEEDIMKRFLIVGILLSLLLYFPACFAEAPAQTAEADEIPSLKDIYADRFDFGTAAPQSVFREIKWMKLIRSQFSILTPENELKPDAVLDIGGSLRLLKETGDETAVAVRFDAAKPLLRFASQNGIKVHGHVLVWHSQTPETFFHESYDAKKPFVTREVMLGRLENYIRGVMEYLDENYPGVVISWDVLNEAIDDSTCWLRNSNWRKIIGDDYPNRAYEYARKYAPEGTLLYYNDYNTAMPAKLKGIVRLLNTLIPDGNIDGYGFQMHHKVASPSIRQIKTSVDTVAALGLRLRVSELDVGVDSNSESAFRNQARRYADIMKILLAHSDRLEAVQVWGITDTKSWRSWEYPLLFNGRGEPKPAFWAVADPDSVQ